MDPTVDELNNMATLGDVAQWAGTAKLRDLVYITRDVWDQVIVHSRWTPQLVGWLLNATSHPWRKHASKSFGVWCFCGWEQHLTSQELGLPRYR